MHLTPSLKNAEASVIMGPPQSTAISFSEPQICLSWAPWNGGLKRNITHAANLTLDNPTECPSDRRELADLIRERLKNIGLPTKHTVALLTAVPQEALRSNSFCDQLTGLTVDVLCTVGLGNAMAPGDSTFYDEELDYASHPPGTINIFLSVNRGLTDGARTELLSVVTLAKCAVMARYALPGRHPGSICMGTGTDCVAILSPASHDKTLHYAGMHCKLAMVSARAVMATLELALKAHSDHIADQQSFATAR